MFEKTFTDLIILPPNNEGIRRLDLSKSGKILADDDSENTLSIYFRYFYIYSFNCNGYTGYNCEFDCFDSAGKIECDFDTGEKFCQESNKINPPSCSGQGNYFLIKLRRIVGQKKIYAKIMENVLRFSFCDKNFENNIECACLADFYGKYCHLKQCKFCNPVYGKCVNGECQCIAKNKGGKFCNESLCPSNSSNCLNGGFEFII